MLALDCEMVGTGPEGAKSALARVVVVNAHGNAVLDMHVRPTAEVTDFRTAVSGVRPHNLAGAPSLAEVQPRVAALLSGRLLVGHALKNDLKALLLSHPRRLIRDTAAYAPLMRRAPHVGGPNEAARRGRPARLQELAASQLGLTIQSGEHSPVEDARAALLLYQKHSVQWEASLTGTGRAKAKAQREGKQQESARATKATAQASREHGLKEIKAQPGESKDRRGVFVRGGGGWSALLARAGSGAMATQQRTQQQR